MELERNHDGDMAKQLEAEKRSLAAQLQQAQAKLDGFRKLLLGDGDMGAIIPEAKPVGDGGTGAIAHKPKPQPQTVEVEPVAPKVPGKPGRKPGKAMARAQNIFDALRAWNAQHPEQTLAISPGLLETQFKIYRGAAKQFCEDFSNEINEHHTEIGVENASFHNRGKDLGDFKVFVEGFH